MSRQNRYSDGEIGEGKVIDPNEITQARRIRALLERREQVINALEETSPANIGEEKDISDSRLMLASKLRSLILDLYPLLLAEEYIDPVDADREDTDETLLGSFVVEPPEEIDNIENQVSPGSDRPTERLVEVPSIEWFIRRDFPITIEWEVEYNDTSKGTKEHTKEVLPPLKVCIAGTKKTMEYMNKMNIEVEISSDPGRFGYDYDELESEEQRDHAQPE